jgi:hypothetical protein
MEPGTTTEPARPATTINRRAFLKAAAAFGLAAPSVMAILGTNVAAIATPHGSAATMLVRSGGASRGTALPLAGHLRGAWRHALAGSGVALALLAVVR